MFKGVRENNNILREKINNLTNIVNEKNSEIIILKNNTENIYSLLNKNINLHKEVSSSINNKLN